MNAERRKRAFTVIELLVVIAIIAILATMVISAVGFMFRSATDVRCVGNMKAWSTFINLHATRNKGVLPKLAMAGQALYECGDTMKVYFVEHDLPPEIAFCPANSELYAAAKAGDWGEIAWEDRVIDFDNPYTKVDNTSDTDPVFGSIPPITIDNTTSGGDNYFVFAGDADTSESTSASGYCGSNYRWIRAAGDHSPAKTGTGTWHFKIPAPPGGEVGDTENLVIEGWWPRLAGSCINDTRFTITHEGGDSVFHINQQTIGGKWHTFGTFDFKVGSSYQVTVDNSTSHLYDPTPNNRYIYADAIRVSATGGDTVLPASGFAVMTEGWIKSEANSTGYPPGSAMYLNARRTTSDHKTAVWVFVAPAGEHTVYGWWPSQTTSDHATGVPMTIHQYSNKAVIASASVSQKAGGTWLPIVTCEFAGGEKYYVQVSTAASAGTWIFADTVCIPRTLTEQFSAGCFTYLYLGYRAGLPDPPIGAEVPATPLRLLHSIRQASSPSQTPILVDWLSDNPTFESHKDYVHVLTLGGGVHKIPQEDATHRWTSGQGVKFYW